MKFTRCLFIVEKSKICLSPISYTTEKNFYQVLQPSTTFDDFFTTIINVYHFLPPCTSFYYVPSTFANFYTTFHQSKTVFFFYLLICTNHTILLDVMLQALNLCLFPFYMFCVVFISIYICIAALYLLHQPIR